MKYSKIILPTILVSSSLLILFGVKRQTSQSSLKSNNSSDQGLSSLHPTDQSNNTIIYQKLAVLSNRCRGCGKCVRLDPSHFEMSDNVATVISSTNLNTSSLNLAINNCPGQAIVLE